MNRHQQAAPFVETMIACVDIDHVMVKKQRTAAKNVYDPTK